MADNTEQTEAAPSMTDRIRNTQAERRRAGYERLFGPADTSAPAEADDHDDNGDDAA